MSQFRGGVRTESISSKEANRRKRISLGGIKRWEWPVGSRSIVAGRESYRQSWPKRAAIIGFEVTAHVTGATCRGMTAKEPSELCWGQPSTKSPGRGRKSRAWWRAGWSCKEVRPRRG